MARIIPITQMMLQAQQGVNLRRGEERKNAAYNALRQVHGPIAGDPQAALAMQQYSQRGRENPLRLRAMEQQQAMAAEEQEYLSQQRPLALENLRQSNSLARSKAQTQSMEQQQEALFQGATYIRNRMQNGIDPGTAFDEVAPMLPFDPEQTMEVRDAIVTDPSQLDAFLETFQQGQGGGDTRVSLNPVYGVDDAGNPVVMQPTSEGQMVRTQMPEGVNVSRDPIRINAGDREILLDPITRQPIAEIPKSGGLSADQRAVVDEGGQIVGAEPVPGSTLEVERQAEAAEAETKARQRQQMVQRAGQTVIRATTRAMEDYLPEVAQGDGVMGATQRAAMGKVWGTPEYQLQRQIDDFSRNIGLDRLQQMRESSPTGGALGQVPVQQQKMLQETLGSFDISQPISVLRENLSQLNNIYLDIMFGSPMERAEAVKDGKLDPNEAAQIEDMYLPTEFDRWGRRQEDLPANQSIPDRPNNVGADNPFRNMSNDELLRVMGGG